MLNLLAATGHINYAKSAQLHFQNMMNLRNIHPRVYEQFTEVNFTQSDEVRSFELGFEQI